MAANRILKALMDSSVNAGELAAGAADGAMEIAANASEIVLDVRQPVVSMFDQVKKAASNKYVIGGVAAVAVAGAAYGTYRFIKSRGEKQPVPTAPTQPAAPMSAEQKVEHARTLLRDAEKELASTQQ